MAGSIEIEGLTKSFGGFRAVDDVSFVAEDGKITALLGPSGSGKSTALRMIAGLERPDSGRITIAGEDQTRTSVQERRVGFVFQHYALFRHMTVQQNVEFGLRVRKEDPAKRRARVLELLDLVHMTPFAASDSASRSHVRSHPSPRCFSSTNRSARWTRRSVTTSDAGSTSFTVSSVSRACSSPTIKRKRSSWRTRSS
jgi:ABC-type Fe3+/spermidine/putrescine transport system ATPase subunit